MYNLSFLSNFLLFFSLFFSLFLLLYFFFLFYALFSFCFPFLLSLLFSRSSCFLFSFISLLVYRTRAHAHARVLGFDTHGGVVKRLFDVPLLKRSFLCVLLWLSEPPPRSALLAVCLVPGFCVFFFFVFVSITPRPPPRPPSFVFLVSGVAPALPFFAFFCPLAPFFPLARLFYRLLHFSPLYRVGF